MADIIQIMIIKRQIINAIHELRNKYPILAITGPRQSGKTTLLKSMFPDYQYVNLENPDVRSFAESDPNSFLAMYEKFVIFDEVQRVPLLFSYIQAIADESGIMGQFILSGSQNFHLMKNITQSLAGRVAIFKLFPFDLQELNTEGLLNDNYLENLIKGFYPAIYDREIPSKIFYSNYTQTYIQRDVSELIAIKDIRLFRNFLSLCAANAGQLLNISALANKCGVSQPTAKSWLSALENSYILFLLHPFYENFSKRIVKTPKLYFYDTGLLCHLLKLNDPQQLQLHPFKGSLFENMMAAECVKRMSHKNQLNDIWFWRDSAGHEVDLIVQNGPEQHLFEFKATKTIMPDLFKGMMYYENLNNKQMSKTLVYAGNETQKRTYGNILSWKTFGR